ncbi:MAG: DUF4301 family protein [Bacteroidales bacterium]|nr:DUF4301 family protein [Bacteroidales bacterium]
MDRQEKIQKEIERFKVGFPWMDIVAPATPARGIEVLDEGRQEKAMAYAASAKVDGRCKFVPASGAASRMFKDIFAGLNEPNDAVRTLAANIRRFAFYDPALFEGKNPAEVVLKDDGLGYGSKPKGVIRFHRYPDGECRTAFAEHLVEGQDYMREPDGQVHLTVTISPEHRHLFEAALEEVKAVYEKRYGVKYDVRFTYQDPATDTVAVDKDNKPFLKDDGTMLFRPAGHGALIYNLNDVAEELVSIKNIDNVAHESLLPLTAKYKKVLMGRCLMLRDAIFGLLEQFDKGATPELCDKAEAFLRDELCVNLPACKDQEERASLIRAKLNRPIRVCGMVKNLGEPGGGPFIIRGKDGSTSLQILESVQIDKNDPEACAALAAATHFNPVDLVCCLKDYKGRKFNLLDYVDQDAGFISSKSFQGRELKALELPGLWNGAMSDWNTAFVEVPVETFNPVKVVLDLLRPAHQ